MEIYTIKRDGRPPLKFTGTLIGNASDAIGHNGHQSRWTIVSIYLTQGGKYIGEVEHCTQWQGEKGSKQAEAHATAAELIEWLYEGDEFLNEVSQEAVEDAAKNDPAVATAWFQEVE